MTLIRQQMHYFVLFLILSNQLGLERLLNGDTNFQSIWFVLKILYFVIMTNSYIKVIKFFILCPEE